MNSPLETLVVVRDSVNCELTFIVFSNFDYNFGHSDKRENHFRNSGNFQRVLQNVVNVNSLLEAPVTVRSLLETGKYE
jgi:hypothetical protein